jgi:hypothetical protein
MTISSTTNRVEQAGNDVTVDIPFPYYFLADADLKVYVDDVLQTITTDYTVTGAGVGAGGTVSMHVAPATGETAVVFRDPAITQTKDWVENDPDPADEKEKGFDLLTMICQRLSEQIGRSFVLADSDTSGISLTLPTPVANRLLAINSDATALTLAEFVDSIFVHQSATPATDGSLYLWLNSSTGVFYYLDESVNSWMPVSPIPTMAVGDIGNPLLHLPLRNTLTLVQGAGSVTFTRSTAAHLIDRYGVVQDAAIDAARFEANGLLLEGASTNEIPSSENFNWTNTNITLTVDDIDAPDGNTTADKIEATVNGGSVAQTMTLLTSDTEEKTFSVFIKAGDAALTEIDLQPLSGGTVTTRTVNWSGGVPTPASASDGAVTAVSDDWYRWVVNVTNESKTQIKVWIKPSGDAATGYIYVWGAQYEELPFASSYIYTNGSAVTRTIDSCIVTFADNFPLAGDDFTVVIDVDVIGSTGVNQSSFFIAGETYRGMHNLTAANTIQGWHQGATPVSISRTLTANTVARDGLVYDSGTLKIFSNGVLLTSGAQGTPGGSPTGIVLGDLTGASPIYGHVANFRAYGEAFSTDVMRIA